MAILSVVVITKNEEGRIRRLLASLAGLADEIILVDDHSTDLTGKIAQQEFGAKVFQRSLEGDFAAQRNFGADNARGEWVLSMDADEEVDPVSAGVIRKFVESDTDADAVSLGRLNHLCGKPLPYSGRDRNHLRLYRRDNVRFTGQVHERLSGAAKTVDLEAVIKHYPADSVDLLIRKGLDYNEREARRFVLAQPAISSQELRYCLTWRPLKVFWKSYLKRGGYRDGLPGLVWCVIHVIGTTVFWLKVWQFAQQEQKLIGR